MRKSKKNIDSAQAAKIACAKKTSIGGQALMEGIMMRGPKKSAMAVRDPHGEIVLEVTDISTEKRPAIAKIPIVRGVYNFASSMIIGYKSLMRSAEISGLEELEEEMAKEKAAKKAAKKAKKKGEPAPNDAESTEEATVPAPPVEENDNADEPIGIVEVPAKEELIAEDGEPVEVLEIPPKEEILSSENEAEEASTEATEANAVNEEATEEIKEDIKPKEAPKSNEKKKASGMTATISIISVVLSVLLAVGLFIALPNVISAGLGTDGLGGFIIEKAKLTEGTLYTLITEGLSGFVASKIAPEMSWVSWVLNSVFAGILRIIILVIYMGGSSLLLKDIRRTFEYHGAEHKTIFCYESGLELTVENVRKQRRFHPRCGTSFLVLMLLISIAVGIGAEMAYVGIFESEPSGIILTLIKLALLPLTMGIGYELIKFAGRHDNIITRIISAPGMWLQRLTVKEPSDDMIECAIVAFKAVVPDDNSDNY